MTAPEKAQLDLRIAISSATFQLLAISAVVQPYLTRE